MTMDLNSLARTLAERLHDVSIRCSHNNTESEWAFDCIKCTEAVIREAIDKTLEEAALFADGKHDGVAAAIRSLKQSNSGMEASR